MHAKSCASFVMRWSVSSRPCAVWSISQTPRVFKLYIKSRGLQQTRANRLIASQRQRNSIVFSTLKAPPHSSVYVQATAINPEGMTTPLVQQPTQTFSFATPAPSPTTATVSDKASTISFAGAMPKEEIGAIEFLKEHPECDGRGVIVAIFDTGVDPGAAGLQTTPSGVPKILDVVDGTGSGDVDTSKVVKAEDGVITGLYGRQLEVNPDWNNPTGEWHVGAKRAFELFAGGLKKRAKQERSKKWEEAQRGAITAASAQLAAFQKEHPPGKGGEAVEKQRKELQERLKLLKSLNEKREDLGPLLECVVWHDGEHWRAAIDTSDLHDPGSGRGLLADFTPLTNFKAERQFGTFSAEDSCNFAVNIYEDGNVLSIVVDAGSHGTHVAGITAAYFPDDPDMNGIAPGAQIISCKIGDSRLGSMETNVGLTRALITVLEHGADLINMSYGEATATPNAGRFVELASELVHKHGVVFVSSAGNAGPALSTVGAPGGTSSAILSIGAYVSPQLAAAGHSVRDPLPQGQNYTWSSRGPTQDGHAGVVLSAPGGAIAPVPQWTGQGRQLMNGTSMASPNACGGVALLLSALKAQGQAATPNRVRRALENTCKAVSESPDAALTYGRGLMQVHRAYEYLQKSADADKPDCRYEVTVKRAGGQGSGRGVYLREPLHSLHPTSHTIEVTPTLHEDADIRTEKLAVDDRLELECSAAWLSAPTALLLPAGGRSFEVQVDPSGLDEGLHYAEVLAYDYKARWRGPLFRVPVTLVKPVKAGSSTTAAASTNGSNGANGSMPPALTNDNSVHLGTLHFNPGQEERRFVQVPEGATWAELRLRAGPHDSPRNFMVRTTQLLPHTRYSEFETRAYAALAAHAHHTSTFKVVGGSTLEVTVAQFWSSLGPGELALELEFHGIQVRPSAVSIPGTAGCAKVVVRAPFRSEKVKLEAKLEAVSIPLRPTDAVLTPLQGARDALPEGRCGHSLLLTYKFSLAEAGKVTPRLPMLNGYMYDGELEAQMYMLHDGNKRLLGTGDIYPEAVQLKKGDYVLRLHLRHDSALLLDKLKALPLAIEKKCEGISVPVYTSNSGAVRGEGEAKEAQLAAGERAAFFVGPIPEDKLEKLPKDATPGRLLKGQLQVGKLGPNGKGGDIPAAVPLTLEVPPKNESSSKDSAEVEDEQEEGEKKKSPAEQLNEALRDAKVKFLKDMKAGAAEVEAAYEALAQEARAAYPGHLPLLQERLKRLAGLTGDKRTARLKDILLAADEVIGGIDTDALARHVAQKCPEEGPGAAKRKKALEEQKAALTDALEKKVTALLDLGATMEAPSAGAVVATADAGDAAEQGDTVAAPEAEGGTSGSCADAQDEVELAFSELRRWVDTAEVQYAVLHARREARAGRLATAVRALEKAASPEDKPAAREALELRAELFGRLGWAHWQRWQESAIIDAFPAGYPLF